MTAGAASTEACQQVTIVNKRGLHARASAKFVTAVAAGKFHYTLLHVLMVMSVAAKAPVLAAQPRLLRLRMQGPATRNAGALMAEL